MPTFYTPAQVAEMLHTTENALGFQRHKRRGIPYVKDGRRVLYPAEAVAAYIEANTVHTANTKDGTDV